MKLLVVEDDNDLRLALIEALKQLRFSVESASSLYGALSALRLNDFTIALIDVHLPDGNGLSLIPKIRSLYPTCAVLVITAADQLEDRIRGLDSGADDYLIKPFAIEELQARIRAVLRRLQAISVPVIERGDLRIDWTKGCVHKEAREIELAAKEWAVLRLLAGQPGRIFSKARIADALYGLGDEVNSNTLEVYISSLRRKIGSENIETLRGIGYRFVDTA